jgi:hypothetical protein
VPSRDDHNVYLAMEDLGRLGRAWREADDSAAELEAVILDLLAGQYKSPIRVVAFNTAEHWAQDVSADVAHELRRRCDLQQLFIEPALATSIDKVPNGSRLDGFQSAAPEAFTGRVWPYSRLGKQRLTVPYTKECGARFVPRSRRDVKMTDVSRMANPQEPFVCNGEAAKDDPDVPQEQQPVSDLIIDIARGGLVRNQAQPRRFFDCYRIRHESDHCRRCSSFFAPRNSQCGQIFIIGPPSLRLPPPQPCGSFS